MKTVWNVLSENEITDHPTLQTFANELDALAMVQELLCEYCYQHELDPFDPNCLDQENIADTKFFRFSGGDWEEWVYVMETEITPSTVCSPILDKDGDM